MIDEPSRTQFDDENFVEKLKAYCTGCFLIPFFKKNKKQPAAY